MPFQALRGTTDLFGPPLYRQAALEHAVKRLCRLFGYQEIRTPIIEEAALFLRAIGEQTDIVQKEMFRFKDRGDNDIVLRPEGTAAVVRAYLEHNLDKTEGFAKLFYLGPMFRAERPQAGRLRQFHQYGVEAIGSYSPWVDVEVVVLCLRILKACGLAQPRLLIASQGCRADQARSAEALRKRLEPDKARLCEECRKRFDKNIFRVLDCKNPNCRAIVWGQSEGSPARRLSEPRRAPFLLCDDCQKHFDSVRQGLREAEVVFDDTQTFARGLDYYTQTVFEVKAEGLGAQDTVAAGGRYNHLVEELGGAALGAVGFAAGIERVLMSAKAAATEAPRRQGVYLAIAQPALISRGFQLAAQLREAGVQTLMDYDGKSLKAQLREADKAGCQRVMILGEKELAQGAVTLKDLEKQSQETLPLGRVAEAVVLWNKNPCH